MFRLYFTELRWNGYFAHGYYVEQPPVGTGLAMAAAWVATLFALLHELAHAIRFSEPAGVRTNSPQEELVCDELAAQMLATVPSARLLLSPIQSLAGHGPDGPAPRPRGARGPHFFQTLRGH